MTNDTTTLNGALAELGETMAANITAKGVSASASDGLTTLAGKISQISQSGGGTPVVQFNNTNFGTHFAFTRPDGTYKDTFVVNVPSAVTDIEANCFYYLQNMTGVNLPTGLKTIDTYAFYYCKGLTSLTLPTGLTSIGSYAFAYCQGLTSITIPNTVTTLSSDAFERCIALTSVTIGTGLTSLPSYCFNYCTSLTEITIPSNIASMGNYTLGNCTGMQKIRFESATPPTATSSTFQNLPTTCVIEVPCDSLSAYTSASNYPSSSTYTYVPYGCNGLKFGGDSYTTSTGSCELSLRLWDNDAPVSGGTITITGSDSSTYTCTTDSNGEATCTVSNVTGTVTFTATYSSYSATCTVTYATTLFEDTASADNSSLYTSYPIQNTSGAVNITWDSSGAYKITNNTSSGRALVQFGNTTLQNNVKISADIKLGGTSYKQNGMLAFIDKDSQTTYSLAGWVQGQKYCRLTEFNGTSELQTTSNTTWSSLDTSGYNHHELVYNNGAVTYTITTPSNATKTLTLTLQKSNYIGGKLGLFVEVFSSATHCYIKNIKVEPL